MLGTILIITCTLLWATDAVFRLPLAKAVDASTIILLEHAICIVATLPLFFLRRREIAELGIRGWVSIAFVGVLGSALGTYFFTLSFKYVNPTVSILLQKMQPIFVVLAARLFLGERSTPSFYRWAALALAASTMVSLPELWSLDEAIHLFPSLRIERPARDRGILLATSAALFWGLSTVFGKWITNRVSFPVTSFLRFVFGFIGVSALIAAQAIEAKAPLNNLFIYFYTDPQALRTILSMALISGVTAMYLYYAGLKTTKASAATFAELFFPVASIAVNWSVLGQALAPVQIVGTAVLLLSVFFINRGLK